MGRAGGTRRPTTPRDARKEKAPPATPQGVRYLSPCTLWLVQ